LWTLPDEITAKTWAISVLVCGMQKRSRVYMDPGQYNFLGHATKCSHRAASEGVYTRGGGKYGSGGMNSYMNPSREQKDGLP
jgi:hypothetical protein